VLVSNIYVIKLSSRCELCIVIRAAYF